MNFSADDIQALLLTLKLASIVTFILVILATPLAWWLARTQRWLKVPIGAVVALPLVLPPSVLGFYLLLMMGPQGWIGQLMTFLHLPTLPFSFLGLVIASVIYSLPFMVQPLQNAFEAIGNGPLEAAATLRASPIDTFFAVVIPMAFPGYMTAAIMTFAHTIGEFGVVLMIGGNMPGATRVASVQIYNYVESMEYGHAHQLAACMVLFSFLTLVALYCWNPQNKRALRT